MSKADYQLLSNYMTILKDGKWDLNENVRPKWADGTPAHTIKKFGIVNRYDLQEEFPISGVRKLNWKASIDEIIWIWLLKSNNVKDLNSKIWDQWANIGNRPNQEIGSIGKAYGYQLGAKTINKNGRMVDQVDNVIEELINNPSNRRILTEIYNHSELHEMNLAPCVHEATFNVTDGVLNMTLNQRSNDTLAAGSWNVVQYATLLHMMAQATGLKAGELLHVVTDSHCYDKHVPMELEIIFNRCSLIQKRLMKKTLLEAFEVLPSRMPTHLVDALFADAFHIDKEDSQTLEDIKELIELCCDNSVNFEDEIAHAKDIQKQENLTAEDYKNYLDEVKQTKTFKTADRLITKMLENRQIDKSLGFSTPKLIIDPNVTNFYDFKSPKMRTGTQIWVEDGRLMRDGKIIDNPDSSFNIVGYHPDIEGKELDGRVPVAE